MSKTVFLRSAVSVCACIVARKGVGWVGGGGGGEVGGGGGGQE